MKIATPFALAAALALGSCIPDGGYYDDGYPVGLNHPQTETERPNFGAAWIHLYSAQARALPHGDVHRLSDGSYSVLQMPGGTRMDLLRISPEGIPLGTRSFEVPETYAGCPFMPNEETFVDDGAILSYGSHVFRVDLREGGVTWTATLDGQLQHSSTGFWTVDAHAGDTPAATRLDVATGAGVPIDLASSRLAPGERLIGFRLVRGADESTARAFRGATPGSGRERAIVASVTEAPRGGGAVARVRAVDTETGAELWSHRRDVGASALRAAEFAVVGGRLVVSLGAELVALDLDSGEHAWDYRIGASEAGGGSSWVGLDYRLGMHATADGAEVRAFSADAYLRLDATTGEPRGEVRIEGGDRLQAVEPIGDDYLLGVTYESAVRLLDARTGRAVRDFRGIRSEYHAPVGVDYDAETERLVLAGERGVYAVDDFATNVVP